MTDLTQILLRPYRFSDEAGLQDGVEESLKVAGIKYVREWRANRKDRPDFFLPDTGTAIEVKIKGSAIAILRPLKRYSALPDVQNVVLLTVRPIPSLPETLSGKPLSQIAIWPKLLI